MIYKELIGVIIVGILCFASYFVYIRDIIRGKTRPERATWLIWSVLGTINLASQYALGARYSLALVFVQTVGISIIFILSLWRGVGLPGITDIVALFIACQGLILWHFTHNAIIALVIVICIDAIGVALTSLKAYKDPPSETVSAWVFAGLAGVVTLATNNNYSIIILLYPIYTICLNAVVISAIYTGRLKACNGHI